jgi:hypothetical protein
MLLCLVKGFAAFSWSHFWFPGRVVIGPGLLGFADKTGWGRAQASAGRYASGLYQDLLGGSQPNGLALSDHLMM